mmetsp:Transcript_97803/g.262811  ORF Transcript_97803/g.262811 Transcript_97803/m.262811 type:complete len:282 (-) Transcript_97803:248-1093(-)
MKRMKPLLSLPRHDGCPESADVHGGKSMLSEESSLSPSSMTWNSGRGLPCVGDAILEGFFHGRTLDTTDVEVSFLPCWPSGQRSAAALAKFNKSKTPPPTASQEYDKETAVPTPRVALETTMPKPPPELSLLVPLINVSPLCGKDCKHDTVDSEMSRGLLTELGPEFLDPMLGVPGCNGLAAMLEQLLSRDTDLALASFDHRPRPHEISNQQLWNSIKKPPMCPKNCSGSSILSSTLPLKYFCVSDTNCVILSSSKLCAVSSHSSIWRRLATCSRSANFPS